MSITSICSVIIHSSQIISTENNSWADRPCINIHQNEASSAINAYTVALPHSVVSNFQKCFPAASGKGLLKTTINMDYGFFPHARKTSKLDSRSWTDWFIIKEWFREKNVRKEKKTVIINALEWL